METLKLVLRRVLISIVICCVVFFIYAYSHYTIPIMMYHHVAVSEKIQPNWVNPAIFEKHMAYLKKAGYHVLTLEEYADLTARGKKPRHHSVIVTFDDGYSDVYDNGFPILQKYEIPATVFVPGAFIGEIGYLNWLKIVTMVESGLVDIGSHGFVHNYLPDLPPERQKYEIVEGKNFLEKALRREVTLFAYPIGGFSDEIKQMVKDAGFKAACATNRGSDRFNRDLYELKRIRFGDRDTTDTHLWWKLSGYYNLFRKEKNPN